MADRLALHQLRLNALRRWRPAPLDVPALLVATDDGHLHGAPEFWRTLVAGIEIVAIPGGHQQLAVGPAGDSLVAVFKRLLAPTLDA